MVIAVEVPGGWVVRAEAETIGPVTTKEAALDKALELRREREKQGGCGWCGGLSGFSDQGDGWDRCNECGGN